MGSLQRQNDFPTQNVFDPIRIRTSISTDGSTSARFEGDERYDNIDIVVNVFNDDETFQTFANGDGLQCAPGDCTTYEPCRTYNNMTILVPQ